MLLYGGFRESSSLPTIYSPHRESEVPRIDVPASTSALSCFLYFIYTDTLHPLITQEAHDEQWKELIDEVFMLSDLYSMEKLLMILEEMQED